MQSSFERLCDMTPYDLAMRVESMAATLRMARKHIVTLGGDGEHGDRIQAAVIDEIDRELSMIEE